MPIISESTFVDAELLKNKLVVKDYSTIGENDTCNFEIPVFCDPTDVTAENKYKNDFTAPLWMGSNRYTNPTYYLEELENSCTWTELATLTSSTYGTYKYDFANADWIGYTLLWYKVYNLHGVGCYRIRLEYTDIITAEIKVEYSYRYKLALFNENLADKTTKIEYRIDGGKIGSTQSDDVIDYKTDQWSREIRLPNSFFGFESSEYSREYTRYKNGSQVWIQDEQIETLNFNAKRLPYPLHRELKITALQADRIYISDYNLGNVVTYDQKRVVPTSNYEPKWNLYNTYSSVELTFKPYFENLRRKRC